MQIAIIGAGDVGKTLGGKWAATGHSVHFGVRAPADAKFDALRQDFGAAAVQEVAAAIDAAEVVVLAVPGAAVADIAAEHGARLAGKVLIDTTNNMRGGALHNVDILTAAAPGARQVRAFSTLGWENFAAPTIDGVQVDLFYCGDPSARIAADQLIADVGLRPVYIGGLDAAATVDGVARLWFALAFGQGRGRRIAFKLLAEA